jgi:MoaA/NifB/PqqE/SkfB family radical SAM enzyme
MGSDVFFIDPFGRVLPCNAMEVPMGSLKERSFPDIWGSERAVGVRQRVRECESNCWMIGSVSPSMKKHIWVPGGWVVKAKLTRTTPPLKG